MLPPPRRPPKEIDASITAEADFKFLYDKRNAGVAGPFTVESLSPHRVLAVNENDELIAGVQQAKLPKSLPLTGTIVQW